MYISIYTNNNYVTLTNRLAAAVILSSCSCVSLTTSWENSGFFTKDGLFGNMAAERIEIASANAPDIVSIRT